MEPMQEEDRQIQGLPLCSELGGAAAAFIPVNGLHAGGGASFGSGQNERFYATARESETAKAENAAALTA
jgi:hypothetical protein